MERCHTGIDCDVSGGARAGPVLWPSSKAGVERMKQLAAAASARPSNTRTAPIISNPLTLSSFSSKNSEFLVILVNLSVKNELREVYFTSLS